MIARSFVQWIAMMPPNNSLEPTLLAGENPMVHCLPMSARMEQGDA